MAVDVRRLLTWPAKGGGLFNAIRLLTSAATINVGGYLKIELHASEFGVHDLSCPGLRIKPETDNLKIELHAQLGHCLDSLMERVGRRVTEWWRDGFDPVTATPPDGLLSN